MLLPVLYFYGSIVLTVGLFISKKLPAATQFWPECSNSTDSYVPERASHQPGREESPSIFPEQKGMFFVQSFFELFEVLLSYLSNTLSFLRIGAFAVSHAAMMEVVLMLAGATEGGSPNWIVVVLGNIFVCAMEPDRWYSGFTSGILRDFQSFLHRKWTRIPAFYEEKQQKQYSCSILHGCLLIFQGSYIKSQTLGRISP